MRRALIISLGVLALGAAGWIGFLTFFPALTVEALVLPPQHSASKATLVDLLEPTAKTSLAGSKAVLRVKGRRADDLALLYNGEELAIELGPSGTYWAEVLLADPATFTLKVDDKSHVVTLPTVPDSAPKVKWQGRPSINTAGTIRLPYLARDDVGLGDITLLVSSGEVDMDRDERIPLNGDFAPGTTRLERVAHIDLLAHALTGRNVSLTLVATDGAGNISTSAPAYLHLPSARLTNRTAQLIAALGEELALRPTATNKVAMLLTSVAFTPEDYDHDLTAFLGLRIAYRRLTGRSLLYSLPKRPLPPATSEQVAAVRPLLIDVARHVDAGPARASQAALRLAMARAERTLTHAGTDSGLRQQTFGFLAYAIADYLGDKNPLETMVAWQMVAQRLLISIDEAAERGLNTEALQAFDLLRDLMENALPGDSPIKNSSALGAFAGMGHETAALMRVAERLENAKSGPYADIRASIKRRQNALRALSVKESVPGKAISPLRQALAQLEQAEAALTTINKKTAQAALTSARQKLAEAAHATSDEMVRHMESRLVAARIPTMMGTRDMVDPAMDEAMSDFVSARLNDCGRRTQGPCNSKMRDRLSQLGKH